jgi:hypothetical protein
MMTVNYTTKNNRFETERYIIGIQTTQGKYIVSVLDKITNALVIKTYKQRRAVSAFTEKYGVKINF